MEGLRAALFSLQINIANYLICWPISLRRRGRGDGLRRWNLVSTVYSFAAMTSR
jgi:hypothetical protein